MSDMSNSLIFGNVTATTGNPPEATGDNTLIPKVYRRDKIVYNSYSGTDIVAAILTGTGDPPIIIGELETISYSIHRNNAPVKAVGHVAPLGFVKGSRTIAGSMVFTQFDQYFFYKFPEYEKDLASGYFPLADMMPPFDVILSFASEYGSFSKMAILGVSILDDGAVMSIDDIKTEQTYTYMARGIKPLVGSYPQNMELLPLDSTYAMSRISKQKIGVR